MSVSSAPDEALVLAAIEQVWGSMLFAGTSRRAAGPPVRFECGLQAQIELRGEWNGRLVLTCDLVVASQIAGAMLGLAPGDELDRLDVCDAVGEVLNVVGGSVKGALPGAAALGLPAVREVTAAPPRDESFVVSWGDAPVYVQIVPDAA